jgi:hypothetical protein
MVDTEEEPLWLICHYVSGRTTFTPLEPGEVGENYQPQGESALEHAEVLTNGEFARRFPEDHRFQIHLATVQDTFDRLRRRGRR